MFKRSEHGRLSVREEATFVQVLREKYQNDVAERILSYLLGQYEEWLTHTQHGGHPWSQGGRKAGGRHFPRAPST